MNVIQKLSSLVEQYCIEESTGINTIYNGLCVKTRITNLVKEYLPSGAGINCGTNLSFERSRENKIVLFCEYQHMNEAGYYDGGSTHYITIRPSFQGIRIDISGRDRNGIKDYLYDVYHFALTQDYKGE